MITRSITKWSQVITSLSCLPRWIHAGSEQKDVRTRSVRAWRYAHFSFWNIFCDQNLDFTIATLQENVQNSLRTSVFLTSTLETRENRLGFFKYIPWTADSICNFFWQYIILVVNINKNYKWIRINWVTFFLHKKQHRIIFQS